MYPLIYRDNLVGRRALLRAFAFAACAWLVLACGTSSRAVEPRKWQLLDAAGRPAVVTALALDLDGRRLAVAGDDHVIRVFDVISGHQRELLVRHEGWIRALHFVPGGRLMSGSDDRTVVLWDLEGNRDPEQLLELPGPVTAISVDPQGRVAAVAGFESDLQIINLHDRSVLWSEPCPCRDTRSIVFSPDGMHIAGAGRNGLVRVWNRETGTAIAEMSMHTRRIRGMVWLDGGRVLATCSEDRTLATWSWQREETVDRFRLDRCNPTCMTVLTDRYLAIGGADNVVFLVDRRDGAVIERWEGHLGSIVAVAAAEGQLVSGSFDTTVRAWPLSLPVSRDDGDPPLPAPERP